MALFHKRRVVAGLVAVDEFGMEDCDEVEEQEVRVEGCLLVEMVVGEGASPDVALAEGSEMSVGLIVGSQLAVG